MRPKISVIIPVYNAEKYLKQCLDSIVCQVFKDFEVILVNDGSSDGSATICNEYVQNDSRFKLIHKENGGVSTARNVGLDNAKGEWITFVDSDDVLMPDFLISLLNQTKNNADFIVSSINRLREDKKTTLFEYKKNELLTVKEFLLNYDMYQFFAGPWGKLFKNKVIQDAGLYFNKDFSWGEDALFNLQYLNFCNHVQTLTYAGYDYREVNEGLTNKSYPYSYYLYLFQNLNSEFLIIENRLGEVGKDRHCAIIMGRTLSVIYDIKDREQRLSHLAEVYKKNKNDLLSVFSKSKGLGKICYILLKIGKLDLFDSFYSKLKKC